MNTPGIILSKMFFQSVTQVFRRKKSEYRPKRCRTYGPLAPVPKRPINANPGLKILFYFCTYLPMHFLEQHSLLSSLSLGVKRKQYFLSSSDIFFVK